MGARDIRNAVVVITSASSGFGRAAALAFVRKGASVALASRRSDALEEVAAQCRAEGAPRAIVVPADVTDAESVSHVGPRRCWSNSAASTSGSTMPR
jgi:NADP-dependent 3-hydroxy acid dehydrogenase YdfG